jgi:hypothetical protein
MTTAPRTAMANATELPNSTAPEPESGALVTEATPVALPVRDDWLPVVVLTEDVSDVEDSLVVLLFIDQPM